MTDSRVHHISIVSLDDPRLHALARRVPFPVSDRSERGKFFPALGGFNVGSGSDVDVSFLYSFNREPSAGFDRHLRSEEMFVPLQGDFCIPLAACKNPADPNEVPTPDDFVGTIVKQGEAMILRPNVWHNGGWPVDPDVGVRYIMVLSGHRAGASHQGRIDHIVEKFAGDAMIFPDWASGGISAS
jgi:hypothetical protein